MGAGGAARGSLVNSRWVGSGYGRWHGRWVGGSVELSIGANKASQVGSLHAATGVSRGGSFALKLIPTLHIVRSV